MDEKTFQKKARKAMQDAGWQTWKLAGSVGQPGLPDLLCCTRGGRLLLLELKAGVAETGKDALEALKGAQKGTMVGLGRANADAYVVLGSEGPGGEVLASVVLARGLLDGRRSTVCAGAEALVVLLEQRCGDL